MASAKVSSAILRCEPAGANCEQKRVDLLWCLRWMTSIRETDSYSDSLTSIRSFRTCPFRSLLANKIPHLPKIVTGNLLQDKTTVKLLVGRVGNIRNMYIELLNRAFVMRCLRRFDALGVIVVRKERNSGPAKP